MCQIESPSDSEQTISGFWHYLNYINFLVINNAAKFASSEKKKYLTIPYNMFLWNIYAIQYQKIFLVILVTSNFYNMIQFSDEKNIFLKYLKCCVKMYVAQTSQLLNDNSIWKVSFHMPILVERPYAIETLKDQLSLWDGYTLL